jgi:hypothetical protein
MPKTRQIRKETRDKIVEQSISELEFARKHKEEIIRTRWNKNENMYYGRKDQSERSRSNVMLPKAQGFVETLLSKVDDAPNIRYVKGEQADLNKERLMNALIEQDSSPMHGNWAMKDLLGKKQGIIYGRAIYEYHASSAGEYKSHLTLVDVYDFFIDPSAGGLDIEQADYLGRKGIYKSAEDLEAGVEKGKYIKKEVKALIADGGKIDDSENKEKDNRYYALRTDKQRIHAHGEKKMFNLVEWYTTYKGVRYYVLFDIQTGVAIRVEEMINMFNSELYPFMTWATNPDLVEFWSPSPLDAVREIFMAQTVSINQMLDNAEQINKPMKAYNVNSIQNPSLLNYRRDGKIPFKGNVNLQNDLKIIETPSIDTPIKVYNILEGIAAVESGITPDAKGVSQEERVGILESNIAQVADRLGLLNKSYSDGYHRLGKLYYEGVKEHMTTNVAVRMTGIEGIEFEEISKSKIVPENHDFDISIVSSSADEQVDIRKKRQVIEYLNGLTNNPIINAKARVVLGAEIAGLSQDQIKALLSPEDLDTELMAEAARDIQNILKGDILEPNEKADTAYMQKLVDYLRDQGENMSEKSEALLIDYIERIRPIVMRNMATKASKQIAEQSVPETGEVMDNQRPAEERIIREQNGI